jgi:hypothetical protein
MIDARLRKPAAIWLTAFNTLTDKYLHSRKLLSEIQYKDSHGVLRPLPFPKPASPRSQYNRHSH